MSTSSTRNVSLPTGPSQFVDDHPAIAVFVVLEVIVIGLAFVTSVVAGPYSAEQELLHEIAGLSLAIALIYGVIGVVALAIMFGVRRLLA